MSTGLRAASNVAVAATLAVAGLLGALWLLDRTHRWERPRWERDRFVLLRAEAPAAPGGGATCVAPVNPRCARCVITLRHVHRAWEARAGAHGLAALIVDTPARPGAAMLRAIPPMPVWWDRSDIWRRRWGHRLYGELIEFDAAGRFVRTQTASEFLRDARRDARTGRRAPGGRPPPP